MLLLRIGATLHVSAKLLERHNTLFLQTVILGAEVAIDFGVTWPMPPCVAQYILSKKILGVTSEPRPLCCLPDGRGRYPETTLR